MIIMAILRNKAGTELVDNNKYGMKDGMKVTTFKLGYLLKV